MITASEWELIWILLPSTGTCARARARRHAKVATVAAAHLFEQRAGGFAGGNLVVEAHEPGARYAFGGGR